MAVEGVRNGQNGEQPKAEYEQQRVKDWELALLERQENEDRQTPPVAPNPNDPIILPDGTKSAAAGTWVPSPGGPVWIPGPEPKVPATDPAIWGNLEADPTKRNDLNKPLNDAEEIYNHWDEWGFHDGVVFSNPASSDANPNAKPFIEYAAQNPAVFRAWDKNGDNMLTKDELGQFIGGTTADIKAAEKAYSDYLSKNPNADPASKELARKAALVAANRYLLGHGDAYLNTGHLSAFVNQNNPGVSSEVLAAAKLFNSPGMVALLDNGGENPALTRPDGLFGVKNIAAWLGSGAPATATAFAAVLRDAAFYNISGADTSGIGKDIFTDPGKYTPEQRVAALREMQMLRERVASAIQSGMWDDSGAVWIGNGAGINPNKDKVLADIDAKIATLSADEGVQKYLQENFPAALQNIVNADPALKNFLQAELESFKGGGGGNNNPLNVLKGPDGKDIPLPGRLASYSAMLDTFYSALNTDPARKINLQDYLSTDQKTQIQSYYENSILSGKDLTDLLNKNVSPGSAAGIFGREAAMFAGFLDPAYVQANAAKLQQAFGDAIKTSFGDATLNDLDKVFGDANGNLDEAKLLKVLEEMQAADPGMFKDASGNAITPQAILQAIRGGLDGSLRQPAKISDALAKIGSNITLTNGQVSNVYKAGALHIISSVLFGGIAVARGVNLKTFTPEQLVSVLATTSGTIGLALEGGAKVSITRADPNAPEFKTFETRMKIWENRGKTLGGVANVVGGILSFISGANSLQKGDIANATISFVSGGTSVLSGAASTAEGLANLFGSNLSKVALGRFAFVAGVLGWASAAVGFFAVVVPAIIDRVNTENNWRTAGDLIKEFAGKYGVAPISDAVESDWPQAPGGGMS